MDYESIPPRPATSLTEPNHIFVPMEASDIPTLGRFMHTSSLQQATNRFLFLDWPNEAAQISLFEKGAEQAFNDPSHQIVKTLDDCGDMIGYIMLTRKVLDTQVQPAPGEVTKGPPESPQGINLDFRKVMGVAMAEIQKKVPAIEHFVLSSIFVHPSNRKSGVGSRLVNFAIREARAVGLPIYLMSLPSAYEFYFKLGFKDTISADIDLSLWAPEFSGFGLYRLFGMVLPPLLDSTNTE